MIDTVVMHIPENEFSIYLPSKFTPSTKGLFEPPFYSFGRAHYIKCTFNPTRTDRTKYTYLPRLTVIKAVRQGGFQIFLKVEFSAAKVLFANNFDEVQEGDFTELCWKLKAMLQHMGVLIRSIRSITDAEISAIHYSKNIPFTDYTDPYSITKEIIKSNVSLIFDTDQAQFRNEGHAVKWHSNTFEVTFYDKLKDLQQANISERRALEKDNYVQLNLFKSPNPSKPFEVLRMEVRLGNKKKIDQFLKRMLLVDRKTTFEYLFSKKIAQGVLLEVLNDIESRYPVVLTADVATFEELAIQLQMRNPKLKMSQLLAMVGLKALLAEIGVRKFRRATRRYKPAVWYKLNTQMKGLKVKAKTSKLKPIRKALVKFEPLKLADYKL